jgi:hypothetical protein
VHDNNVLPGTFQSNDITMADTTVDSNLEHNDTSKGDNAHYFVIRLTYLLKIVFFL